MPKGVKKNKLLEIYNDLLKSFGLQGWWPLLVLRDKKSKPRKSGSQSGYHPGDYSYPKNSRQRFEICVGAILTQNTTWLNCEKALLSLKAKNMLAPAAIKSASLGKLAFAIRPAGYYNQKARKLKEFSKFFLNLKQRRPAREELLNIWGIGPETADSILLYAYSQPEFVVDAYTRRLLLARGIIKTDDDYGKIKNLFEANLPADYKLFQELHALIVEHGKRAARS